MYYKFDDYLIVDACKFNRPGGDDDQITTVVFHNNEIIGHTARAALNEACIFRDAMLLFGGITCAGKTIPGT